MFQTRNEEGTTKMFTTLAEAFDEAKKDRSVWKISTDKVRLVKRMVGACICWNNEPLEAFIDEQVKQIKLKHKMDHKSR